LCGIALQCALARQESASLQVLLVQVRSVVAVGHSTAPSAQRAH
jgi:hypothetical protein